MVTKQNIMNKTLNREAERRRRLGRAVSQGEGRTNGATIVARNGGLTFFLFSCPPRRPCPASMAPPRPLHVRRPTGAQDWRSRETGRAMSGALVCAAAWQGLVKWRVERWAHTKRGDGNGEVVTA